MSDCSCGCDQAKGFPPCIHCGHSLGDGVKACPECGLNAAVSNRAQAEIGSARRSAIEVAFWLALIPLAMVIIVTSGITEYRPFGPAFLFDSEARWMNSLGMFAALGGAAQCVMLPAYFLLTTPERSRWIRHRRDSAREFVRYAAFLQTLAIATSIATPGIIRAMVPLRFDPLKGDQTIIFWGSVLQYGLANIFLISQIAIAIGIARLMLGLGKRLDKQGLQRVASVTTFAAVILGLLTLVNFSPSVCLWLLTLVQMGFMWRYTRTPNPSALPS